MNDLNNLIKDFEKIKDDFKNIKFRTMPIPSKKDEALSDFIENACKLSLDELKLLRYKISVRDIWTFTAFGERMATLVLRTKNQIVFEKGLNALRIAYGKLDDREILLILSLFFDLFQKYNLSFCNITSKNDDFSEFLKPLIDSNDKPTIKSMGYMIETDKDGTQSYKRTW